jgi:hypothetical protein
VQNVSLSELASPPFKAAVTYQKIYYSPGSRTERHRETYVAQIDFVLRDHVPNEFVRVQTWPVSGKKSPEPRLCARHRLAIRAMLESHGRAIAAVRKQRQFLVVFREPCAAAGIPAVAIVRQSPTQCRSDLFGCWSDI